MVRILDVIEYLDPTGREMVHRIPDTGSGDFRIGSQLIVRESQAAVFFRDGKALDVLPAGRHTITTSNIPLLVDLLKIPFSGQTPFKAEVYFVNLREFIDQKWGTPEAIPLRDSELGLVRLRAFGTYAMQVSDPQLFVNKIVGTQGYFRTDQIETYLRNIIVAKLTDLLGEARLSLFDLPAMYDELAAGNKAKLGDDFAGLGIALKAFYISSVTPTEETAKAIDERAAMGAIGDMKRYLQFKTARAIGDAAAAGGTSGTLAEAGAGLGAGAAIGVTMAKAVGDALAGGQQQAAPAGAAPVAGAMVACPNCQTQNPASAKFCNNCGFKLGPAKCPNCGNDVAPGSKFCNNCGHKLA